MYSSSDKKSKKKRKEDEIKQNKTKQKQKKKSKTKYLEVDNCHSCVTVVSKPQAAPWKIVQKAFPAQRLHFTMQLVIAHI